MVLMGSSVFSALATVGWVAVASGPAQAQANGPGEPLVGDVNGDGADDRATLGQGTTGCRVVVELGDGAGGFGAPVGYEYASPGGGPWCPDMGVIVDLGGDGVSELVLAWFDGRPPGVDDDLIVLRDYTPVGGFRAIEQPSGIGTADFDGDGLVDVYEYTDQGDGFQTYLNTPTGELVPGPLQLFAYVQDYVLADFDGDGAIDLAASYVEGGDPYMGVAVVLDDGTHVQLESEESWLGWGMEVLDANGDGHLDVETINHETGATRVFYGAGDGTFSPK
jgi:hypothetical protein